MLTLREQRSQTGKRSSLLTKVSNTFTMRKRTRENEREREREGERESTVKESNGSGGIDGTNSEFAENGMLLKRE